MSGGELKQLEIFDLCEWTRTGLEVHGELTERQWETIGCGLRAVEEARQWAIGDWLNAAPKSYGDGRYKRAAELTGMDADTCRQLANFAARFENVSRDTDLSFKHHKQVASLHPIATDGDGLLYLADEFDQDKATEFLKQAKAKDWSTTELRKEVQAYQEQQREHIRLANEPDKYSVIYADPPWQYTSGDQHTDETQDTVLGDHYPSMSLREICDLPVDKTAATDAVLFLWVTSPTLEESMEVIKAWGFKYKASMIWDKVAHNVGNYVSVRHELLLIATRGQPPKVPELVDSVYVEERTEHSRKPSYFRELIDSLYPSGLRLEMFARGDLPDNWKGWGNEA